MGEILITGASGQLGRAFAELGGSSANTLVLVNRHELDLSDAASIREGLKGRRIAGIINGGAYTAVDRAETNPAAAWAVNATAPLILAEEAFRRGIPLVQVSTDYVYSGDSDKVYQETDPLGPLSVYGGSKAAGELAVLASHAKAVIARTSWVVSPFGSNFVKTMLRLGREREELRVVADQKGAPTSAHDLAVALLAVMDRLTGDTSAPVGAYHVTNAGETTWFGVAQAIFETAEEMGRKAPRLLPITTKDYPTPARRPSNSRLSGQKLERDFGLILPNWKTSLQAIVRRLVEEDDD